MPSSYSLPVLSSSPMRLTPTDVSQFVRLDQCERFLRFRLAERAGQDFMKEYDVNAQRITPLLSLSGHEFEEGVEADLGKRFKTVNYAEKAPAHNRPTNNPEVIEEAKKLAPGESIILFQPRLEASLHGWLLRGDLDLVRLQRDDSALHVLVTDMKSTTEAKVEHRLQVAFYRIMLEKLLDDAKIGHAPVQTGILFRPTADPTPEQEEENKPLREAAKSVFGLADSLFETVADGDAYLQSAHDLVLAKESTAHRVASTPFDDVPF